MLTPKLRKMVPAVMIAAMVAFLMLPTGPSANSSTTAKDFETFARMMNSPASSDTSSAFLDEALVELADGFESIIGRPFVNVSDTGYTGAGCGCDGFECGDGCGACSSAGCTCEAYSCTCTCGDCEVTDECDCVWVVCKDEYSCGSNVCEAEDEPDSYLCQVIHVDPFCGDVTGIAMFSVADLEDAANLSTKLDVRLLPNLSSRQYPDETVEGLRYTMIGLGRNEIAGAMATNDSTEGAVQKWVASIDTYETWANNSGYPVVDRYLDHITLIQQRRL